MKILILFNIKILLLNLNKKYYLYYHIYYMDYIITIYKIFLRIYGLKKIF